jgi:hypothetical protein
MARIDFMVTLDGITLSAEQKKRLNGAIQKAALTELAGIGIRSPFGAHFPKGTLGIWFGPLGPLERRRIAAIASPARVRR